MSFPFYRQHDAMDCGPTCLKMVAKAFGSNYELEYLRANCFLSREGVSLLGISEAAEKIGLRTLAVKTNLRKLADQAPLPTILHWNQNHFVVLYKIKNDVFHIADPGHGLIKVVRRDFEKSWLHTGNEGVCLLVEATPAFFDISKKHEEERGSRKGFWFLAQYLRPYKAFIGQILLSMLIGSGLTLIFPFLTQALVDYGISHRNISFVKLMLLSQLALFFASTAISLIRSWLMLHMNARVNIMLLSDFLIKLMRLPISFFDSRQVGDIQQRIGDHSRIQSFLTGSALTTLFSIVNLIVFTCILGTYSTQLLIVFAVFSGLGVSWILLFLKRRKHLDYARFQRLGDNQNLVFEMITAMQEIKLSNSETQKRWNWERLQSKLFYLNIKSLQLNQIQQMGSVFLNQSKNIIISYISACEVISGHMTLGMMMSVSYIIGQMNSPIESILEFIQSGQDARISLDRLSEIHNKDEEDAHLAALNPVRLDDIKRRIDLGARSITLKNLSYQYQGPKSPYALKNINLTIFEGRVTAIVGASGSGKTTLLKMLLQFYPSTEGSIYVGNDRLDHISPKLWRSKSGMVMQEGFIFSDTIANNISAGDEHTDHNRLEHAVEVANIKSFIESLPVNYNTKIGPSGLGLSTGQKQRILIARAVYKNPDYLFFDEATSALDANNEKQIIRNLDAFFKRKTVVVVAHRLSTVKHADQIVVLDKGEVREIGTHAGLVEKKGLYYELIKNQLELGN